MKGQSQFNRQKFQIIIFFLFLLFWSQSIFTQDSISTIFERLDWKNLALMSSDQSHRQIADHFEECDNLKITQSNLSGMGFIAKFRDYGEVGTILFNKSKNLYSNLRIHVRMAQLSFVSKIRAYAIQNKTLQIGDARIHFISGILYQTIPMNKLFLFSGKWTIKIQPDDQEERLTLKRKYNTDVFFQENKTGLLYIKNWEFLSDLSGEIKNPVDIQEIQSLLQWTQGQFGIYIKEIKEYWYIPLPHDMELITFPKDNKGFFYYIFNPGQNPDSRLFINTKTPSPTEIILSYNKIKGPKIQLGGKNKVSSIKLDLAVNDDNSITSGEAVITYENPSTIKIVNLNPGMSISSVGKNNQNNNHFIYQRNNQYYILGPSDPSIRVTFNGNIQTENDGFEIFRPTTVDTIVPINKTAYLFLDRFHNYYPNPGTDYSSFHVKVTCPPNLTCLASADRVHSTNINSSTHEFKSPASMGLSLVMGNFKLQKKLNSDPPINIYTHKPMELPRKIKYTEIQKALSFFSQTFGSLNIDRLNIVLKSGLAEGGISQRGLIVMTLPYNIRKLASPFIKSGHAFQTNKNVRSPVILRDIPEDYIIHEIAHQWWGGMLSPKGYQDIWINEGLAQMSLVLHLRRVLKPKKFARIIRVMRRWVLAHGPIGPVIYGKRILSLTKDFRFYQSIIYNKSTFILLMLMDIIGEEDFFKRLQNVVNHFKFNTINTSQFIQHFSQDNVMAKEFLNHWIYHRAIPKIKLILAKDDKSYDHTYRRTIVLQIQQLDTNIIFPLRLKIITREGTSFEDIIINNKNQRVVISQKAPIGAIEPVSHFSLFKEVVVSPVERKKFRR